MLSLKDFGSQYSGEDVPAFLPTQSSSVAARFSASPGAQAKIAHMRKIVCVLLNMLCDVNVHVHGELNRWLRSH